MGKLKSAGYRANEKKSEFCQNETKWLGHEIDEDEIKPNKEKSKAILHLKQIKRPKTTKILPRGNTVLGKGSTEIVRKNRQITKTEEKYRMEMGTEDQKDFEANKKMLTEEPALAHYAKDKDNIVTTDASKTSLGITLWQKQAEGE